MLQYILVGNPFVRSLWTFEAANANGADIFIFWLAIAAYLNDLFSKPETTGIPVSLSNKITLIFNKRYDEFFKHEFYFVTFCLDPRTSLLLLLNVPLCYPGYPKNRYLKSSFSLPKNPVEGQRPIAYFNAYTRVKAFLKDILKSIITHIQKYPNEPVPELFEDMDAQEVVQEFRRQLDTYWREEHPFQKPLTGNDPLAWWKGFSMHSDARVLAVSTGYSICFVD